MAKELPHDLLSEKSLLGCLISDGQSFDHISDLKLVEGDFYSNAHGIVFAAISELMAQHQAVDYVTVCAKLKEGGKFEIIGGSEFVTELVEEQASSANIYYYGKTVKEKANMREIIRTTEHISNQGRDFSGNTEDFIQEVEKSLFAITTKAKAGKMSALKDCLVQNLKDLDDNSRRYGEIKGVPTGYAGLDNILLGMQPGQLIVVAARPAMGKTALALNIARNACKETKLPVAIFSLEMRSEELSMRLLSSEARIDLKLLRTKGFEPEFVRPIGRAVKELSSYPIFINDAGDSKVFDIQSHCRKIQAEHGLGLVIVDYLQLMSARNSAVSREQQIAEMSRFLKVMAKELDCPVITVSQLNRGPENRPSRRPTISDLRESGAIEQDADVVVLVHREDYYNPDTKEPGVAEIIVGKNRSGETGVVKLAWTGRYTSFENLSYNEESAPLGH